MAEELASASLYGTMGRNPSRGRPQEGLRDGGEDGVARMTEH